MSLLHARLNPPLSHWQGKCAWIVGASSGIGRATSEALHAQGARVIVSARDAVALHSLTLGRSGFLVLPLDVTQPETMAEATATVKAYAGAPDLVLYCAGRYRPQRATAFDLLEMKQHLAVNYVGALQLLDAVIPMLLDAGRGHLALVGSVAGYRGLPMSLAYGPTKAALNNLAENLYLDLHPRGLGVSIINPGFVDTPLTAQNSFKMPALISSEEAAQHILRGWKLGHFEMNFPRRFTRWVKLMRCLPDSWYFSAVRRVTGM
ncbi:MULTISPECIES: SDR family NAD(P)-dependent oxidoreductase [Comamonas]|uniref:SDR family NAD(P)-dependent oxidoreductase n=1 Tax=Comamonas TaxID=283 RepID=UPI0001BB1812|nr:MULTISPECIES: SDR family NAD(P)-dependent oxidoreductase [Comamonas]ACY32657.1 short-chain dehydrogenase/reductase SDR [Comamonas thiooxydans]MDO1476772.1 SDR family NAD(P)-dependent oxidoreductase [Comamonas thiooxydans]QOQ84214.1 SDR family NAD(P)-dependent oxidoreductase [Comamonas thiooxydans]CUB01393.1 Short-chain dehydrogenase [Comamonas thiooxydans]BDB69697.1 oxidoreductase [Comamonas thiooxydans]